MDGQCANVANMAIHATSAAIVNEDRGMSTLDRFHPIIGQQCVSLRVPSLFGKDKAFLVLETFFFY